MWHVFWLGLILGLIAGFRVGVWAAPSVLVQRLLSKRDRGGRSR